MPTSTANHRIISARVPAEDAERFAEQSRRFRLTTSQALGLLVKAALDAERAQHRADREAPDD